MTRLVAMLVTLVLASCSNPDTGSRADASSDSGQPDTEICANNGVASCDCPDGRGGYLFPCSTVCDCSSSNNEPIDFGGLDTDSPPDMSSPDASPDAGADLADTAGDTGNAADADAGADPFAGRPLGQCATDSDCPVGPLGQDCSEALPGGACLGCGSDAHCPGTTVCSDFGTCVTECSTDEECPPGLECKGTGRCGAVACVNGTCPVSLFGCSASELCARIDCSGDPTLCPAGTACNGGWCIEMR